MHFEKLFWGFGCEYVAGVDEAGVAPLAGPVAAAAVIFPKSARLKELAGLKDSKLLSAQKREYLREIILEKCLDSCVAFATVSEIDKLNIFQATRLAMRRALAGLKGFQVVLVDGPHQIPEVFALQMAVVDGEAKIFSIAAASILAKTARDAFMLKVHGNYPQYGFNNHKGYPTKEHIARIRKFGASKIHRRSFLTKIIG